MPQFYVKENPGVYRLALTRDILREANRLSDSRLKPGKTVLSTRDAKEAIGYKLRNKNCEINACLFLDISHRILSFEEVAFGTINKCTVYPREIVRKCLQINASAIIFAHNHPSGDSKPSIEDLIITKTLWNILRIIDVNLLDHLIIGKDIYSLSDTGFFQNTGPDFCRLPEIAKDGGDLKWRY